ncbi:periplasmic heavy metal sensor [Aestuariivirga sp.]|uniref:periplasmic heavy metal sensor n=1 Tax=Aestuariivirga sp. TaxID=2650926 RepID=UPI0030198B1F
MSDPVTTPEKSGRRANWLMAALIASLAVNLLVAGAAAARWYVGVGPERYARLTQTQLIPRNFFRDLDRARRTELLAVFKAQDKAVREGRRAVKAQVVELADALEAEPYDAARVKAAVEGFTAKSEALFMTGGGAALELIDKLGPEERKLMAQYLRTRDDHGRGKPGDDKKPDAP